jgi:DNA primase catalytic core
MKPDFAQIKRTTDLVAVVQRYGIELKREGKDWRGKCPFHDDQKRPNFIVSPDKGLWRCPACNAAGNVIQFVARMDNLTEREAALKLLGAVPGVTRASKLVTPAEPAPVIVDDVTRAKLLARVASFYAKTLRKCQSGSDDRAGLDYLKTRRLDDPAALETFAIGYCNGSMRNALPKSGEIVEQLQALGVLNEKGNEVFYKRIVVPIYNAAGDVVSLYGRRLDDQESKHLLIKGERRGVFNGAAAKSHKTLVIVESIFDALSVWSAGFHNVIALRGTDGWTDEHVELIRTNGVTELYLALDNDNAGEAGVAKLLPRLAELGVVVHRLAWPDGVKDANAFFSSRCAADFAALLKAANPQTEPVNANEQRLGKEAIELTVDGFAAAYGEGAAVRRYELCAVLKPSPSRLKATVKALAEHGHQRPCGSHFVIDTLDFYSIRSKRSFIAEAARMFRQTVDIIEADVNRLTIAAENYVTQKANGAAPAGATVSDEERAEGARLGRAVDLVGEILRDIEKLGLVGERINKLLLYVVMTSRKMTDPLAVQVLSGSGAGKSHLQDAVLSLCPEEDLIKLTSLSNQALFYKGEDSLRHKALAVEEVAGAEGARYAIRNLISAKRLTIETTVKNPLTGRLETQVNTVHGPTAVFETTTNPDTDPETKSRFILTSIDESAEQTRRILDAQRQSHTLEGMKRRKQREAILARHHAFQRSLRPSGPDRPLAVVNPFEPLLAYGDDRLVFRRDQPKYLRLILAVTFLHQHQRAVKHDAELGDYIETTLDDIAIANELAAELFGQSLDDLSPPSRELLRLIVEHVERRASEAKQPVEKIEFSRRELREALKWSEYQLRTHLRQLVKMEYLVPVCGRQGALYSYRLVYQPEDETAGRRFVPGLKTTEQLRQQAEAIGLATGETSRAKSELRGLETNFEGTSRNGTHEVGSAAEADEYSNGGTPLSTSRVNGREHISAVRGLNGAHVVGARSEPDGRSTGTAGERK